jgi:uncharacterized protein (TIGR02246 family)
MLADEEIAEYIERERIKALKYRYIWAMDANEPERVLDVFTPDAVFYGQHKKTNETYIRKSGHEELYEMVERRGERTDIDFINHRAYTPRIEIGDDTAYGYWYMTNIHSYPDGGVDFQFGYYADKYRKVDGEWKISHLTAEFILVEPPFAE